MVIENIIQHEILGLNRDVIKRRISLKKLLENPVIHDGDREIKVSRECLEKIAKSCNLPQDSILLPITFFIPAGSYEGYLTSEKDYEVVSSLGYELYEREGRYWIAKYKIRKLVTSCPGVFQSVIVP